MNNIVTTDINTNVVVVTSPGPSGPAGPAGPQGNTGTVEANSGFLATPFLNVSGAMAVTGSTTFSGSVIITGSLTVSGSNTFINIGPALFTGSVGVSGSVTATLFSGSGAGLTNIPASGITGLNLNRIASGSVSASVSPTGKAFNLLKSSNSIFSIDQFGNVSGSGLYISGSSVYLNGPDIRLYGNATLNDAAITTTATTTTDRIQSGIITASVATLGNAFTLQSAGNTLFEIGTDGILSGSGANLFNIPASGITGLNLSRTATGSVSASVNVGNTPFQVTSGSSTLMAVSSSGYVTASGYLGDGSRLSGVSIPYVNTGDRITSIEVADFDTNVAVTFVGGALKFVFGTPVPAAISSFTLSGFATDRFNAQNDNYDVIGNWANNGYTLISASISTGSVVLTTVGAGSSLSTNLTTSGSQSYRLAITSSNPLDSSTVIISTTVTGTLSKSRPNVPTISITGNTVQLGIASNQIEEGATGDISFSAAYGSANAWEEVSLTTSPSTSPQNVLATGTVTISATSNYQSPAGANVPQIFDNRTTTNTYSRIRSLRYGADTAASFTEAELQNLAAWDTGLGGTIGTIAKGTTNPSGQSITITWTGDKYHYIVFDSARSNLSNITTGGFGVLSAFSLTTVGSYKVYRTNTLQAGGAGTSITYVLT